MASTRFFFKDIECTDQGEYDFISSAIEHRPEGPLIAPKMNNNFDPPMASGRFIFACVEKGAEEAARRLLVNLGGGQRCKMNGKGLLTYCYEKRMHLIFGLVLIYPQWCDAGEIHDLINRALKEHKFTYFDRLLEHEHVRVADYTICDLIELRDDIAIRYLLQTKYKIPVACVVSDMSKFQYLKSLGCPIKYDDICLFHCLTRHAGDDMNDFSMDDVIEIYKDVCGDTREKIKKYINDEIFRFREDYDVQERQFSRNSEGYSGREALKKSRKSKRRMRELEYDAKVELDYFTELLERI